MGVFPACISSCLWLLSRNDFQKHQHSAQAYKEAQPPVGFATHAPAWLLLNIRHKPFIYTYCFLLLKIRPISTVINSDIPISVWHGWDRTLWLFQVCLLPVPCSLHMPHIQGLFFCFDWPNSL